jgi:hypothetical protein
MCLPFPDIPESRDISPFIFYLKALPLKFDKV